MKKTEPYWPLILLLALIKFVLPIFLQSSVYELQRDEYLYYQQGQHFDWGYMENPPLLSYLGMISSWLGGSEAWIKFWPCLFGAGTVVFTCLIAAQLGGNRFAQFLAGIGLISGAYLRIHFLFQPNFLDIFFWTLSIYALIAFINSNKSTFLYLFCIGMALGFLSKYSVVFVAAGLVIALLLTKHRKIFVEKKLYIGIVVSFLIVLPNIIWQYQHNWPLVHHMKELQETQLRFGNPLDFIKDQFLMLLPVVLIWTGGLIWLFRQPTWRFLAFTYLLVIILLVVGRGKSYYSLGMYPVLLAAGGVMWERLLQRRVWIRVALSAVIIFFTWVVLPLLLPIWEPGKLSAFNKKNGFGHTWEDKKEHDLPQDFADMLGWKELTEKTERFYHSLPDSTRSASAIFCRHYGQAGSLIYYGKDPVFRQRVITDNGSFLHWIPEDMVFDHLIFIGRRMPGSDDEVFQHFQSATIIDSVTNIYSRQLGDKIIFFQNIDTAGLRLAKEGLREMKKQFTR